MAFKPSKEKNYMDKYLSRVADKWSKQYQDGGIVEKQSQPLSLDSLQDLIYTEENRKTIMPESSIDEINTKSVKPENIAVLSANDPNWKRDKEHRKMLMDNLISYSQYMNLASLDNMSGDPEQYISDEIQKYNIDYDSKVNSWWEDRDYYYDNINDYYNRMFEEDYPNPVNEDHFPYLHREYDKGKSKEKAKQRNLAMKEWKKQNPHPREYLVSEKEERQHLIDDINDIKERSVEKFKNLSLEELKILDEYHNRQAVKRQNDLIQKRVENPPPRLSDLVEKAKDFVKNWKNLPENRDDLPDNVKELLKETGPQSEVAPGPVNEEPTEDTPGPRYFERQRYYQKGGKLKGPSHDKGGIPGKVKGSSQPLEFEGGEVVINTSVNGAADKHGKNLLALNKNPDDFEIVRKTDARKRTFRIGEK